MIVHVKWTHLACSRLFFNPGMNHNTESQVHNNEQKSVATHLLQHSLKMLQWSHVRVTVINTVGFNTRNILREVRSSAVHGWHTEKCAIETLSQGETLGNSQKSSGCSVTTNGHLDLNTYHLLEVKTISFSKIWGQLQDAIFFWSLWFWLPVIARALKSKAAVGRSRQLLLSEEKTKMD